MCDTCTRFVPGFFFATDETTLEVIWGVSISAAERHEQLYRTATGPASSPETHFDLGRAYRKGLLLRDALLELATSAALDAHVEESPAIGELLRPVSERNTFPILARAIGLFVRSREGRA